MKKILLTLLTLLILAAVAGFAYLYFSLNSLVKKAIETVGPAITRTDVTLSSANLSPLDGNGSLNGFVVGNPKGFSAPYAVKLGNVSISVDKSTLLKNPIIVNSIEIRDPRIALIGTPGGTNLQQLMRNIRSYGVSQSKPSSATPSSASPTPAPLSSPAAPVTVASPSPAPLSNTTTSSSDRRFIVRSVVIDGASLDVALSAFGQSYQQTLSLPEIRLQNLGSDGNGISGKQLAEQILSPLINAAIDEGIKAASKQGLIQLQQNGGKELGNFLKGLFK